MNRPLDELLRSAPGFLVLLFSEGGGLEEQRARAAAAALAARPGPDGQAGLLVELTFSAHREQAAALGIHGFPAVAAIWKGRLLFHSLGAASAERLAERLQACLHSAAQG